MKKNPKSEFLSVRLSSDTKAQLEKLAETEDRSLSWVVSRILEKFINSKSQKL